MSGIGRTSRLRSAGGNLEPEDWGHLRDLKCVVCWKDSGPPHISCTSGHLVCETCYEEDDMKLCPSVLNAMNNERLEKDVCKAQLFGVDENIKNTRYYQYFMQASVYNCGSTPLGCEAMLSGMEIRAHEDLTCPYRVIRQCGFDSRDCDQSFKSLHSHIFHLIQDHAIPVASGGEGYFAIRFDRHEHDSAVPLIRGILIGINDNIYLVMAYDKVNCIRIGISDASTDDNRFKLARLLACSSLESTSQSSYENLFHAELPVYQTTETVIDMDGHDGFFNFSNEYLEPFGFVYEKDGGKYFKLKVTIREFGSRDDGNDDLKEDLEVSVVNDEDSVGCAVDTDGDDSLNVQTKEEEQSPEEEEQSPEEEDVEEGEEEQSLKEEDVEEGEEEQSLEDEDEGEGEEEQSPEEEDEEEQSAEEEDEEEQSLEKQGEKEEFSEQENLIDQEGRYYEHREKNEKNDEEEIADDELLEELVKELDELRQLKPVFLSEDEIETNSEREDQADRLAAEIVRVKTGLVPVEFNCNGRIMFDFMFGAQTRYY